MSPPGHLCRLGLLVPEVVGGLVPSVFLQWCCDRLRLVSGRSDGWGPTLGRTAAGGDFNQYSPELLLFSWAVSEYRGWKSISGPTLIVPSTCDKGDATGCNDVVITSR